MFNLAIIQPKPKLEDQLWIIEEIGDLNSPRQLGDTKEEADLRKEKKKGSDDIITVVTVDDVQKVMDFVASFS